ncbi:zonular occludens toxin domain-containing protein [Acinetobacter haemolyticus]|uniref:zonular occludens toxin domain-containing protein n=1 Tax=Acinetobacter haemolyticus TaxID=29430 RepID=UPI0021CDC047|nr:zonular occludens toxin domain-containing protein [Acinetobacter haemolyticus]MCU4380022.1 zonular occludens toxin domain-containing protein [Acinetobacter haemolyticus]
MSIVISAPIRTGKTLLAMEIIDKVSKKEPYRMIYTNIIGCTYPGVISIQSTPDRPFDWRDLPNGAVLIYDECHEHPAFSKEDLLKNFEVDDAEYIKRVAEINANDTLKVKEKEELVRQEKKKQEMRLSRAKEDILDIGRSLTLHGHFGIDIYFITQKPYLLNASVRASCNEHLILRRLFKLKAATIYTFAELQEQFGFSTMKNALSWRFWRYPKQLYKFYISAEEHEKSKKIPLSLILMCLAPILLAASALKDSYNSPMFAGVLESLGLKSKQPQAEQVVQQAVSDHTASQSKSEQLDCNLTSNLHLEECQIYQRKKNEELQSNVKQAIAYNAHDPYRDLSASFNYQASTQPVFSGCVKFEGKYYGYSQQGTRLNIAQEDCKRLIEQGDRPFNYFADQNNRNGSMVADNNNRGFVSMGQEQQQKMTPDQYARYLQYLTDSNTANNVVIETQTLKSQGFTASAF